MPSVPTPHIPPVSQETSAFNIEADSSSTLSRDSPFSSTFFTQPSAWGHRNSNQDSSYRSTFHLRPSQESESHASNSSFQLSGHSSISPNIDLTNLARTVEAVDDMGDTNAHNLPNAPQHGPAGISSMDLTPDTVPGPTRGATTTTPNGDSITVQMQLNNSGNPTTVNGPVTRGTAAPRGGCTARGGRGGRGGCSARGRGQTTRGGGASRASKRPRAQPDVRDPGNEDEDNNQAPQMTKKRKFNAAGSQVNYPTEIHRRNISLRERLIDGEYEPQLVGMRAYKLRKAAEAEAAAAAAAKASANSSIVAREFLVPIEPQLNATTSNQAPNHANNTANADNAVAIQPNPRIAYKSTPVHQLHFPEGLFVALKRNLIQWEGKAHSESTVFVVSRLVHGDIVDMHIFTTLREATSDAIWMMVKEHPEAFALPATLDDEEGIEIKLEKFQRATSLLRDINARPTFTQVYMRAPPGFGGNHASSSSQHTGNVRSSSSVTDVEEQDSLFVTKNETGNMPRPQRYTAPRPNYNNHSEALLRGAPEPVFVFSGQFRFISNGLKMEARRADGTIVKVAVRLGNLRKPVPM
ncbi:hypothetical protein F4803DRAFT_550629 [Xylaria telfairii]|nr:hypothetical protein F4803DRAFT_550629 [Xylaria telfairii]